MTVTRIDRAALVRRALVELVAERGFRGTLAGGHGRPCRSGDRHGLSALRLQRMPLVAASPLAAATRDVMDSDESTELVEVGGPVMLELFVDLPMSVVWDLSMGPIIRLVSSGESLARDELDWPAATCWAGSYQGYLDGFVDLPLTRDALQTVFAAVGELQARAGDQVSDGA